jgi:hypothetical protein
MFEAGFEYAIPVFWWSKTACSLCIFLHLLKHWFCEGLESCREL